MTYKVVDSYFIDRPQGVGRVQAIEDALNDAEKEGYALVNVIPFWRQGYQEEEKRGPLLILHKD